MIRAAAPRIHVTNEHPHPEKITMAVPLIIDDDGNNYFHHLTDDPARDARDLVDELPASVTDYMLCPGAGTFYFPTKIARTDPHIKKLNDLHAAGIDPFGILLSAIRHSGRRTFITCRMNDVHNPTDADEWNMPLVRKQHPDAIVDAAAVQAGNAEWMCYCLDYARPEVRAYFLAILTELVERYHATIDGLQLDWMRFPRHLSGSPDEVWSKREHLTGFVADVRAMMRRIDSRLKLSVRVPAIVSGCRYVGIDVPQWVERDLVDMVVVCPFLTTSFSLPIEALRGWIGARQIPLYAGHDFHFGMQNPTPESMRGSAASLLDCGADGVYVFNFPCWIEYLAARPWHWLKDLPGTAESAAKPMLVAVDHKRHRLAHVDPPAPLPMSIADGASATLSLRVPRSAMPIRKALALMHCGGDFQLLINGHDAPVIRHTQQANAESWSEIFIEYLDPAADAAPRPRRQDCRVFRVDPRWLLAGENTLTLKNLSGQSQTIGRVNLGLW